MRTRPFMADGCFPVNFAGALKKSLHRQTFPRLVLRSRQVRKKESDVADSAISRVVIIGSGQAGVECAAALRHQGFPGSISVVGDDPNLPYQRPPLSKEFLKSATDTSLPLKGEAFYASNDIRITMLSRLAGTSLSM